MKLKFGAGLALLAVLAGCQSSQPVISTEIVDENGKTIQPAANQDYISGIITVLPVGNTDLVAGVPGMLTIAVHNGGNSRIELPYWLVPESANIIFHYIPCDENGNIPENTKPEDWTTQTPVVHEPLYYPLILMPGNTSPVRSELSFVEKLPADYAGGYYLVVAELNQKDFKIGSMPFVVTVYP